MSIEMWTTGLSHVSVAPRAAARAEAEGWDGMVVVDSQNLSGDPFVGQPSEPDVVRFVSVLAKRQQPSSSVPLNFPSDGEWSLRILSCQDRFVLGVYRREMKAIGYLGQLEKVFGVPVTTRNWNTILAIGRILNAGGPRALAADARSSGKTRSSPRGRKLDSGARAKSVR